MKRTILKSDWWALAVIGALFVAWLATGEPRLRYAVLGCAFLYLFVVRIVAHNLNNK